MAGQVEVQAGDGVGQAGGRVVDERAAIQEMPALAAGEALAVEDVAQPQRHAPAIAPALALDQRAGDGIGIAHRDEHAQRRAVGLERAAPDRPEHAQARVLQHGRAGIGRERGRQACAQGVQARRAGERAVQIVEQRPDGAPGAAVIGEQQIVQLENVRAFEIALGIVAAGRQQADRRYSPEPGQRAGQRRSRAAVHAEDDDQGTHGRSLRGLVLGVMRERSNRELSPPGWLNRTWRAGWLYLGGQAGRAQGRFCRTPWLAGISQLGCGRPDGIRTRDLRLERAAS